VINTPEHEDIHDGLILVVEDDLEDIYVLQRSIAKTPLNVSIDVVHNGQEAIAYLEDMVSTNRLPELNLILLDLNMPLMDGHEFLRAIRADLRFRIIPVVVLTTSQEQDVTDRAYGDGANAVISKADTLDGMMVIADTIVQFWFNIARTSPPADTAK